ncbi:MAG: hypothetical protein H0W25_19275 [Acidimicrobiia bacterium]|nr:hypothetical protein [Acidimicrobiia bacterium]
MPNPQRPDLARSRKAANVVDDAAPTNAVTRPKRRKGIVADAPGPVPEDNQPGHTPAVVPDKPTVPPDAYRVDAPSPDVADVFPGPASTSVRYQFAFEPLLVPFAAAVGVTGRTAWVELDEESLRVRFGPWSLATPRDNVVGCEVTGPYQLLKVAGPPRLSFRDRGVTFATNRRLGACIRFREPVAGLLPFGVQLHPGATVTVTDLHDLARRLAPSA